MGTVEAGRQVQHVLVKCGREVETTAMRQAVRVEGERDPAQDVEQPQRPPCDKGARYAGPMARLSVRRRHAIDDPAEQQRLEELRARQHGVGQHQGRREALFRSEGREDTKIDANHRTSGEQDRVAAARGKAGHRRQSHRAI